MTLKQDRIAMKIQTDIIDEINMWDSIPEVYDTELDNYIHEIYINPPNTYPGSKDYFSPSSANSCPLELFVKLNGKKRDDQDVLPLQQRWRESGTIIGDMFQRKILFMEKHFPDKFGRESKFKFEYTPEGYPMFEEFAKTSKFVTDYKYGFHLFGSPDGIMNYTVDGKTYRVGLEIKSKQTTPSRTSMFSMRKPDDDHVEQTKVYADMFGLDYYVILYYNLAKMKWEPTEEELEKTPDLRAFAFVVTPQDKKEVTDKFHDIVVHKYEGGRPKVNPYKWTFNNFKEACLELISEEEYEEALAEIERIENNEKMRKGYKTFILGTLNKFKEDYEEYHSKTYPELVKELRGDDAVE